MKRITAKVLNDISREITFADDQRISALNTRKIKQAVEFGTGLRLADDTDLAFHLRSLPFDRIEMLESFLVVSPDSHESTPELWEVFQWSKEMLVDFSIPCCLAMYQPDVRCCMLYALTTVMAAEALNVRSQDLAMALWILTAVEAALFHIGVDLDGNRCRAVDYESAMMGSSDLVHAVSTYFCHRSLLWLGDERVMEAWVKLIKAIPEPTFKTFLTWISQEEIEVVPAYVKHGLVPQDKWEVAHAKESKEATIQNVRPPSWRPILPVAETVRHEFLKSRKTGEMPELVDFLAALNLHDAWLDQAVEQLF